MALPWDKREFRSWHEALAKDALTTEQLATLQEIADAGQADSLEAAADLLDWQDNVVDPDEHMYGF